MFNIEEIKKIIKELKQKAAELEEIILIKEKEKEEEDQEQQTNY
jgi:hypothetical protein